MDNKKKWRILSGIGRTKKEQMKDNLESKGIKATQDARDKFAKLSDPEKSMYEIIRAEVAKERGDEDKSKKQKKLKDIIKEMNKK